MSNEETYEATCSECGLLTRVEFKERKFGRGLHETYLTCENCHVKTTAFITNAKVRKLQKESEELRENPMKTEYDEIKLENNFAKISETMDELKAKYGSN